MTYCPEHGGSHGGPCRLMRRGWRRRFGRRRILAWWWARWGPTLLAVALIGLAAAAGLLGPLSAAWF